MRRTFTVIVALLGTLVLHAGEHTPGIGTRWWSHVEALANDGMEGRGTGTPAHARAAAYVAAQFQKAGLEPAGTAGYLQAVRFKTRRIIESKSSLALVHGGRVDPLALGDDAAFSMRADPAPSIDAPMVFVGYGVNIPDRHITDLAGLNLRGAVVVHLAGMPRSLPGVLQAHFGSSAERWKMYKAAGAIGTLTIADPNSEIPWARAVGARLEPAMSLADPALDDYAGQQLAVSLNAAIAEKLFEGSGHTFAEILECVDTDRPLPRFPLAAGIAATVAVERSELESQNVAGILRGSDPRLRDEHVVLSAHLDHTGIGEPVGGDRIYNGAMDNASGVAALLEVATAMHESVATPSRSILFLAVTGEELGELGSRYFVSHPTVRPSSIVADVNTDMFLPLFPLKLLMVLGLDESDIGRDIRAVAASRGLAVQADPEPWRHRFIRSDQYSFAMADIPALAMKVGYEEDTPEASIAHQWIAERYHQPSDDLTQPVDLAAAQAFVGVVRDLALRIANRSDRPAWSGSSIFRRFATPPAR